METFNLHGTKYIEDNIKAKDRDDAVAKFEVRYGIKPEWCDGGGNTDGIFGFCEMCQKAIWEGQKYRSDHEGVMVHDSCFEP